MAEVPKILMHGLGLFLIGLLVSTLVYTPNREKSQIVIGGITGLIIAVILAEFGKQRHILAADAGFPSAHEAFGTAAATTICALDSRWIICCAITCFALGWALYRCQAHQVPAIFAGGALGALTTTCSIAISRLIDAWLRRRPVTIIAESE